MKLFRIVLIVIFSIFMLKGYSQNKSTYFDSTDYYCEKLVMGLNADYDLGQTRSFIVDHKLKDRLFNKRDAFAEQLKSSDAQCLFYTSLANLFFEEGNFKECQPLLIKGLRLSESSGNLKFQSAIYNMIGNLFAETNMYERGIVNFKRAIKIALKTNEEIQLCTIYANMSNCLYHYGELHKNYLDSSLKYNYLTIELATKLKRDEDLQLAYQCKGLVETDLKKFTEAEASFRKAIAISLGLNNSSWLYYSQYQLARMYIDKGGDRSADSAIKYLKLAKVASIESNDNGLLNEVLYEFARVYQNNGDYKLGSYYALRFAESNDSLSKLENARTNAEMSEKYESVKREAQITELNLSQKEKQAQIDRQLYMIIGSVVILIFVGFAAFSLYRSNQIRKKANHELSEKNTLIEAQKKEVEKQKELVDEKNKEILDSIHYAKRIQQSLLPTQKYMERNLSKLKKDDKKV